MQWIDKDKGLTRLIENMLKLSTKEVKVGFFDTKYDDNNENLYVAQVAQWQEEGHKNGAIFAPPRPFFRQGFHNGVMTHYKVPLGKLLASVGNGTTSPHAACKKLGEGLKFELEAAIENGNAYPANSPSWREHKQNTYGITTPLTYTGLMGDSVKYKITNVGSGTT